MTRSGVFETARILFRTGSVVLGCGLAAACSNSLTTGATAGGGAAIYTGQPMPPALVGTNPAAAPANVVTMAALPPATTAPLGPVALDPTPLPTPAVAAAAPVAQAITIIVAPGETLYSLSRTHGVSVAAIAAANGLTQTSTLNIGQRLVIPAAGSPAALGNPPAPLGTIATTAPAAGTTVAAAPPAEHIVRTGETMYSIALTYGVSPAALARANNMQQPELLQVGQRLVIPAGGTQVAAAAATTARPAATTPTPRTEVAVAAPTAGHAVVTDVPRPTEVAALPTQQPVTADPPTANGTSFRWPLTGARVISDFGPKPGGERNDGINLAAAAGTAIKAAEAGTVIYAGNEIPGYGNLILIRHADNWVTAYAHTSRMLVAKDDVVQRGQTIALVGATGSVTSPQLHFELRRGSTPVNPLSYLLN